MLDMDSNQNKAKYLEYLDKIRKSQLHESFDNYSDKKGHVGLQKDYMIKKNIHNYESLNHSLRQSKNGSRKEISLPQLNKKYYLHSQLDLT